MSQTPLDTLIRALSRLPGLGPRSARRVALHMLTNREGLLRPLLNALEEADRNVKNCEICGNLDTQNPCRICQDPRRNDEQICVVAGVADLWAIERTSIYKGRYHILGGVLSAMDGVGPDDLRIRQLINRVQNGRFGEVIMALSATVDGQATIHYLTDRLEECGKELNISRLAHGVPVGGELDYLDDGTIATALKSRSSR